MQVKVEYLGNRELLETHKTAFLCSRRVSSPAVLRCYDWATEACRSDGVVVSGFQSRIERDVLHFMLQWHYSRKNINFAPYFYDSIIYLK